MQRPTAVAHLPHTIFYPGRYYSGIWRSMTSEVAATLTKHCFVRETGIIPEAATSEVLAGAVGIMASPHIVVIAQTGLNIGCIGKLAGRSRSNVVGVVPDWGWQWRHAQITTVSSSDAKIGRVRLGVVPVVKNRAIGIFAGQSRTIRSNQYGCGCGSTHATILETVITCR